MNFFQKLRSRKRDMQVLSALIKSSLAHAAGSGSSLAGAHHLALAGFKMNDGVAERALASLDSSGAAFASTVESLDTATLAELGIASDTEPAPAAPPGRLGKTDATFEAAITAIHRFHNEASDYRPLTSGHVLAGVATVQLGVAARTFAAMNLDRTAVIEACQSLRA